MKLKCLSRNHRVSRCTSTEDFCKTPKYSYAPRKPSLAHIDETGSRISIKDCQKFNVTISSTECNQTHKGISIMIGPFFTIRVMTDFEFHDSLLRQNVGGQNEI